MLRVMGGGRGVVVNGGRTLLGSGQQALIILKGCLQTSFLLRLATVTLKVGFLK